MTKRMLRRLLAVGMAAAVMLLVGLWDMAIEQKNICTNRMLEQALPLFEAEPLAEQGQKVAYLTFDDGPSKTTEEVLDILAQYQVKATFFVCGADNNEKYLPILARTVEEGHQIGLHSCSHQYKKIYTDPDAFWEDLDQLWEKISPYVAQKPVCIRFPGGSTNTVSRKYGGSDIMEILKQQATEKGYRYFDWNDCAGDAAGGHPTASELQKNVMKDADKDHLIVLMHDTAATKNTVEALPGIIEMLQQKGYIFDTVENYPQMEQK